jgi:hypothetical protein
MAGEISKWDGQWRETASTTPQVWHRQRSALPFVELSHVYTRTVRFRAVAFVIALFFGLSPVVGAICELDCDDSQPKQTQQDCHRTPGSTDGTSVRDGGHACGHRHNDVPAFVAGPNARDVTSLSVAVLPAATLHSVAPAREGSRSPLTHGPPGSTARITAFSTILRI